MTTLRFFFRRHPFIAVALLSVTLLLKVIIPAGYMVSSQPGTMSLTVMVCTGIDTMQKTIEIPVSKTSGHEGDHKEGESPCAFTALGHASLGGADGFMLAILLAFILALGIRGDAPPPISRRAYLRPPPRGPPLTA